MTFPLMPISAVPGIDPGELEATMDTSTANIAVGDIILLVQKRDGGGNPTLPAGFNQLCGDYYRS